MRFDDSPNDWEPSLPPEPETYGGGMSTEPGPDPFGFMVWMWRCIYGPRTPAEMLALAPLHLLGYVGF